MTATPTETTISDTPAARDQASYDALAGPDSSSVLYMRPISIRLSTLPPLLAVLLAFAVETVRAEPPVADLVSVYDDALRHNPGYRGTRALLDGAEAGLERARGQLRPQLSAFAEGSYVDESITGDYFGIVDVDREDDYERYLYGAQITQAVLQPALWADRDKASLQLEQAQLAASVARGDLLLEVAEAYFGALAAQDAKALAEARLESVRQQRDQVASRTEAGLATDAERQFAEAELQLALSERTKAESNALVAMHRLHGVSSRRDARILGLSPNVSFVIPEPSSESAWVERARRNNPQVRLKTLALAIAEAERRKADRSRWPTVDVVGNAYQIDAGGGLAGERDEREMRIGLRAQMSLYSGGQVTAAIAQADAQQIRTQSELEAVTNDAVLNTRLRYLNLVAGQQQLAALGEAVVAARKGEAAARVGFEAGTRTNADVFSALEQRYSAEVQFEALRYQLLVDTLRLKRAAGMLDSAEAPRLNRLLDAPVSLFH